MLEPSLANPTYMLSHSGITWLRGPGDYREGLGSHSVFCLESLLVATVIVCKGFLLDPFLPIGASRKPQNYMCWAARRAREGSVLFVSRDDGF